MVALPKSLSYQCLEIARLDILTLRLQLLKHVNDPWGSDFTSPSFWLDLLRKQGWLNTEPATKQRAAALGITHTHWIHLMETCEFFVQRGNCNLDSVDKFYSKYLNRQEANSVSIQNWNAKKKPQIELYRSEFRQKLSGVEINRIAQLGAIVPLKILEPALRVLSNETVFVAPLNSIFIDSLHKTEEKNNWPSLVLFSNFPSGPDIPKKYIIPYLTCIFTFLDPKVKYCEFVFFVANRVTGVVDVYDPFKTEKYLSDAAKIVKVLNHIKLKPLGQNSNWTVGKLIGESAQARVDSVATCYGTVSEICQGQSVIDTTRNFSQKCLKWRKLMLENYKKSNII